MYREFPPGFQWGASTAAHQVEGGTTNDWTRWERANADRLAREAPDEHVDSPVWDAVADEATDPANYVSGRAVDHYERYEEDFDIAARLGHTAHRFSVEWSRVEPERGVYDHDEIAHYRDVARALRDRGIEPFVTLWHFTNPEWFADAGGWESGGREAFVAYVRRVVRALRDDVSHWITINEPEIYASSAYLFGNWPPQKRNPVAYFRVRRHLLRAHRAAATAIREEDPNAQVGIALNVTDFDPVGRVPDRVIARISDALLTDLDLRPAANSSDFLGVNHYFYQRVRWWYRQTDAPRSDLGWELHPDALGRVLEHVGQYGLPIYVTENGLADRDDVLREWYLKHSLAAVHRAIGEGVDVRGYLHWSLLDNFEWDKGFWPRFGLVSVDRETMARSARPSALAYAEIARRNGLAEKPSEEPPERSRERRTA